MKISSSRTLKELKFPFPDYRSGQRDFAVAVYKTILDREKLFASAPTGIGKTISTLFPSLKAIGEGKAEKVFYLCAKNVTATVAYDTLRLLYKQEVSFKSVAITAKDKICFQDVRNCDPEVCPYAKAIMIAVRMPCMSCCRKHSSSIVRPLKKSKGAFDLSL